MTVNEFMVKSGIPAHYGGFELVERAIELCMEMPDLGCMKLYEIVAKENGIKITSAERRIRYAVEQGLKLMDEDLKHILFNNKERVKRNEYVKTVAYAIKNHVI